ncbi:MAG: trigger factor [Clostridiales bacterium]|nr:trigger factor [Clostridiales bacterium]
MSSQILSKEGNIVKISFDVTPEKLEEGIQYAYDKNKSKITLPGFRKGKVPRKVVEAQYGVEFFYEDAVNFVLNETYPAVVDELELDPVDMPNIDVKDISKEIGAKFEASVTVRPEVKLGQYKGIEVEDFSTEITEDEINAQLKKIQNENARLIPVEDRPAQMDDTVNISYLGTVDGVPFEGGESDSYDLKLGSHSFIDTFEDQICGHSIGDKFDVNVTFPDEYHAEELKGKAAVFAVELKGITMSELPELNDDFAQDVSEFDTFDEYKASEVEKLTKNKEESAKRKKEDAVIEQIIANAEMDVPEVMYDNRVEDMMNEYEQNMKSQGITLEMYCQFSGITVDGLKEQLRPIAKNSVDAKLVMDQIVKDKGIEATDEEIQAEIQKYADQYGIEVDKIAQYYEEDPAFKQEIAIHKAIDLVCDSAVVKAAE